MPFKVDQRERAVGVKTQCSQCAGTHSFTPTVKATAIVVQLWEN